MLPLSNGTEFDWELCEPTLLVQEMPQQSPQLASAFRRCLARRPPTRNRPWRIALAFDEYVPGDKHALDNRRKLMNVGFTFLELSEDVRLDVAWYR